MRVLVALDRTEEAERAATVIARWASGHTLDVHLLHVLHPHDVHETMRAEGLSFVLTPQGTVTGSAIGVEQRLAGPVEARTQAVERLQVERLDFLRDVAGRSFPGRPVECHVEDSDRTAEAIVAAATRLEADFIAMAARRRGSLSERLFGSVHEDVVRHSPVPVLVIGPDAATGLP